MTDKKGPIDFWFDFLSPFGWFASLRIEEIAARHGRETVWHSMLLGVSVLKVMGLKPLLETPLKGDYLRVDAARYARRHALAFKTARGVPTISPLPAARAFQWAKAHHPDRYKTFAGDLYAAYWSEGRDIGDAGIVAEIGETSGLDGAAIEVAVVSDEIRKLLRAEVEASLARGVFGSPFVIVDGEPFWGVEKLELLEAWLSTGGW
ncbi:MAG TPA: 2-hydroxychromene-2-carboxylate isomerase [Alphaproteobacteria bacterium]|nr:2-hydroxychromene-2-carboxylate isomerase [Alphaproteobacteria bacterium]